MKQLTLINKNGRLYKGSDRFNSNVKVANTVVCIDTNGKFVGVFNPTQYTNNGFTIKVSCIRYTRPNKYGEIRIVVPTSWNKPKLGSTHYIRTECKIGNIVFITNSYHNAERYL